ncbi:hypothetical protein NEF87_003098 [Candidatus Lokiarchaeum ossiferum]|uniref:Tetratricopeptide repeat protein n=1 Tax=Candidatus Lokiarchaeum ossiferum TaxID=2951803 RepID=A0ABY6HTG8_9ARCH|nr:hypothetical protein NEF87_003098 [Candidatus Lokiarchaeum sp. B-35]
MENFEGEFQKIEKLYEDGDFKGIISHINSIETIYQNEDLPKYLKLIVMKGSAYNKLGFFIPSQDVLEKAADLTYVLKDLLTLMEIKTIQVDNLFRQGLLEAALTEIEKSFTVLHSLPHIDSKEYALKKSKLFNTKAGIFWQQGKIDEAIELVKECMRILQKYGFLSDLAKNQANLGILYTCQGNMQDALNNFNKALKIAEELKNPPQISRIHNNIGWLYRQIGELEYALVEFQNAIEIAHKIGNKYRIASLLNNIGAVYWQKGDPEMALEYLEESFELNIIHGNDFDISTVLLNLIEVLVEIKRNEEANTYFEKFEKICESTENPRVKQRFLLSKGLILKGSNRPRDRFKAQEIFDQLIQDNVLEHEKILSVMLNLCDLYIEELKIEENLEIIDDIQKIIDKLLNKTNQQHSHYIEAETRFLQAKVELIQLNPDNSRRFLAIAQKIAQSHGLTRLALNISNYHDSLLEEELFWRNLKAEKAPLSKRLQKVNLGEHVDRILRKNFAENEQYPSETPVLLSIINESGPTIYSHQFLKDWNYDDQLFGGLMSAFHSFCNDLFKESFDRARFGKYNVIVSFNSPIIIIYLYMGPTFAAQQHLEQFINDVFASRETWQQLIFATESNNLLQPDQVPQLEKILERVFSR